MRFLSVNKILAGWQFKNFKIEIGSCGNYMIDDVGLDQFIILPDLVIAKTKQLHRNTAISRLQISDHHEQVLIDMRIFMQKCICIGSEYPKVRLVLTIDQQGLISFLFFIVRIILLLAMFKVWFNEFYLFVFFDHLLCEEFDRALLDKNMSLDPSSF